MRRLAAEGIGSLLLAATVVGSGIMAQELSAGNAAIALLANTLATVAVLFVLITLFAPVSGAHFNPAVSLMMALRRRHPWTEMLNYMAAQVIGCCLGAVLAHVMFQLPLVQSGTHVRTGVSQWIAELVATMGLLLIVLGHRHERDVPWMVAAWIGAAYWFTSSTSFANPAITLARSLSNTFAGIRFVDVGPFVVAQLCGALCALPIARLIFGATDVDIKKVSQEVVTARSNRASVEYES